MSKSFCPELHQELGVTHLLSMERVALWAAPGLGKTSMALSAVNTLFENLETRGVLIVAPLRVCVLTWPNEIAKWTEFNWMRIAHVMTKSGWDAMERKEAHVYIISWDNIAFLAEHFLHGKRGHELPFDTIIFDETTRAKNHESKRVNKLRAYLNKFQRRWGLTGTPAPNSLLELFAQIRLLDDGVRFGPSFSTFRQGFFLPVDYLEHKWVPQTGAEDRIYRKVSDIALVLRAQDYLKIADTVTHDIEVAMPKTARPLYDELAENLMAVTVPGKVIEAVNAGVLMNKLLQITGGAVYLEQTYNDRGAPNPREVVDVHDAKIKELVKLRKQINEPLLIAFHYRHEQDRILKAMPDAFCLEWADTPQKMGDLLNRWNRGQIPALLAHPQSIGHGLNMQDGGRVAIWYSVSHSREMYDQLNSRLARKGQNAVPEVYRIVCPGSADDAVLEVLETREANQSALLEAVKHFRALFSLGKLV